MVCVGLECGLWAAEELAKPIVLRHTFHFQGHKATAQVASPPLALFTFYIIGLRAHLSASSPHSVLASMSLLSPPSLLLTPPSSLLFQADGGEWGLTFLTRAAHATAPALLSGAHNLDTVDAEARSLFPSSLGPMRGPSVLGAYMLGHVARAARAQATTLLQHAWDDDQVRGHKQRNAVQREGQETRV